jgi:protein-disulfide isomerase
MEIKMKVAMAITLLLAGAGCGVPVAPPAPAAPPAVHAAAPAAPAPAPAPPTPRKVEDPKAVYRVPVDGSPVRGPADALVTIVEAVDFECPFCRSFAPTLKQVEDANRGKVRFVLKHNPTSGHRRAVPAAALVEEAREERGDAKAWAVADRLLAAETLDRPSLDRIAAEAGLEASKVKLALDSPAHHIDRMRRDQNLLNALGAKATPTLFVNGRKIVGAQSQSAIQAVIDEELARARALVKAGTAPGRVYAQVIERAASAPVMADAPVPVSAAAPGTKVVVPLRPDDPALGPRTPVVTVVEFSDFQCPFCSRAVGTLKEVEQAHPAEVQVVFKHLPLPFHPNAVPAALAAEAAREQGKFWEMHDKLFANGQSLSGPLYEGLAKELGLDMGRFHAAMAAPSTRKRVEEDIAIASAAGVTGTPTFVVNGEVVVGAGGLPDAVSRHLKAAKGGTP